MIQNKQLKEEKKTPVRALLTVLRNFVSYSYDLALYYFNDIKSFVFTVYVSVSQTAEYRAHILRI